MIDPAAGDHAEIRSVGRALDLLDFMQRAAPAGIRVRDAAAHLKIDPATASRLLATLISRGYASRMPNRRYTLGARSLRLASGWIDRLLQVAAAPMTRIANGCGETVYLLQLVGGEAVTLARLPGTRRTIIDVEVGLSYPLWATAAGRALLGTLPRAQAPSLAARAVSRIHPAHQDHLGGCQCGDHRRTPQRHACGRRRDRFVSELLRHSPFGWRSRRKAGARRELRIASPRQRTTRHPAGAAAGMASAHVANLSSWQI